MLFFTSPGAPEPDGLLLDAAGAARQRARRLTERRRAALLADRLLARIRRAPPPLA